MPRLATALLLPLVLAAQDPQSTDPKQRARAARDLARQGSEAIPRLQPLLADPVLDVRIEAVKAIVDIGTQRSLDALIQAARDNDPEIQIRATDGLVNFYLPGYLRTGLTATLRRAGNALTSRWTDTNDQVIDPYIQVRAEVVDALARLARGGSSIDSRANAARALGVLRGRAAIPALLEALRSKDTMLIYESLIALQKIHDPGVAPGIFYLLHDLDEKVQVAAIETTGLLQNKEALPELRNALERARSSRVRRAALTAIAMLPDESSRKVYSRYFTDRDDALRAAAAEGFARLKKPGDLALIEKAFNDERKMNPRLSQAFALVSLGRLEVSEHSPLQYLVNTLNSRSWRGIAQPFLIELARDPKVRQALYPALAKGTSDEKIMLSQVFARSGDKDSLGPLEAVTKDQDADVVQEALRALRNLKARPP